MSDAQVAGQQLRGESSIVFGPVLVGELEVHVCRCPRLMQRELCHVFPHLAGDANSISCIPTCQHTGVDLVKVGDKVDTEKDRCLEIFDDFGRALCAALASTGYWADYIDPCSGLPMLTPDTNKVYSEVDGVQLLLRYATMDAGACKILLHPKWGSSVYPASAFTNAPPEEVAKAIAALHGTPAEDLL